MYFLLKMGIFQPAMLVYQRVNLSSLTVLATCTCRCYQNGAAFPCHSAVHSLMEAIDGCHEHVHFTTLRPEGDLEPAAFGIVDAGCNCTASE